MSLLPFVGWTKAQKVFTISMFSAFWLEWNWAIYLRWLRCKAHVCVLIRWYRTIVDRQIWELHYDIMKAENYFNDLRFSFEQWTYVRRNWTQNRINQIWHLCLPIFTSLRIHIVTRIEHPLNAELETKWMSQLDYVKLLFIFREEKRGDNRNVKWIIFIHSFHFAEFVVASHPNDHWRGRLRYMWLFLLLSMFKFSIENEHVLRIYDAALQLIPFCQSADSKLFKTLASVHFVISLIDRMEMDRTVTNDEA